MNKTMEKPETYSSHMPIVGVYIALASLACLVLMVLDVGTAYQARRRWIPCKYFSLNSITIQMLVIAAKVSLDLTTEMPRIHDQIPKLTGTTLICFSMVFFLPSLGVTPKKECFMNLISLSIFVITVVWKVSFQIYTGVIDIFIYLHIIILCFMSFILVSLWFSAWDIHNRNRISIDENKAILSRENGSMFRRLKSSCLAAYLSNSQLLTSVSPTNSVTYLTLCFLLGSLTRFVKELFPTKSSYRQSDYKWSVKIIIFVQIVTCMVGGMATIFRVSSMKFRHIHYVPTYVDYEFENMIQKNPILGNVSIRDKYSKMFLNVYIKVLIWVQSFPLKCWYGTATPVGSSTEWQEKKGMEYLQKKVDAGCKKSPICLPQLLAQIHPSRQWHAMELRDQAGRDRLQVHSLSLVLLVRIAQVSLREDLWRPIVNTFGEVRKIIYYIDKQTNQKTLENDKRLILAKAVWAGNEFRSLLQNDTSSSGDNQSVQLARTVERMKRLNRVLPSDPVRDALDSVVSFINRKTYLSLHDLYMSIQQTFVDMLHVMLSQLPIAIFKILIDCPAEKYQKNVAKAVSFICQVRSVEARIQWSCPVGSNISRLITEEDIGADAKNNV